MATPTHAPTVYPPAVLEHERAMLANAQRIFDLCDAAEQHAIATGAANWSEYSIATDSAEKALEFWKGLVGA